MGAAEIEAFLSHLASERSVTTSTQNQALAALLFLYREILKINLSWLEIYYRRQKAEKFADRADQR